MTSENRNLFSVTRAAQETAGANTNQIPVSCTPTMKNNSVVLSLFAAAALVSPLHTAIGAIYQGTITCTFTNITLAPQNPQPFGVSVGDTFTGWYQLSPTLADETYLAADYYQQVGDGFLAGLLDMPAAFNPPPAIGPSGGQDSTAFMTLSGGVITDFHWGDEWAGAYSDIYLTSFDIGGVNTVTGDSFSTAGTVTFSYPTEVPEPSTARLAGGGALALVAMLGAVRRFRPKALAAPPRSRP